MTERDVFARRDFMKIVGAGTAGMATFPSTSTPAAAVISANVDLYVLVQNSQFGSDGHGTITVTVGNAGTENATGDAHVVLISPFYANFRADAPPQFFHDYIVLNASPHVPEVIELHIPADRIKAGEKVVFDVALILVPGGPRLVDSFRAIVHPTVDIDITLLNNMSSGKVTLPITDLPKPPSGARRINLYFTYDKPRLKAGPGNILRVVMGNRGPDPLSADAHFLLVSPYMTKIDRGNRPFSYLQPTYLHDRPEPWIPDIVSVPVSRFKLWPDPNLLTDLLNLGGLSIPLVAHPGGPASRGGKAIVASQSANDFDTDLTVAISTVGVIQP